MATPVVAVANQKGGVAKTTTTLNLGAAIAETGRRVLLVDLDAQACLTYSAGADPDLLERSLHDVLLGRCEAEDVLIKHDSFSLIPATIDLAGAEVHLLTRTGREQALARAIRPLVPEMDLVLIDCPPSLGILTICGLTAATGVLVPMQCETLAHRGVGQLLETIDDVRAFTNPDLELLGAVATMYDGRTRLSRSVIESVTVTHGIPVLDPPIPKSVRAAEAPGRGIPVLEYAPRSKVSQAYRALARTMLARVGTAGEQ